MKTHNTKMKGKKALSMLLAVVMVLSVASPAFSEILGINAKAFATDPYAVELAYNNLFVFDNWARNKLSTTIMPNDEDNPYGKVTSSIEDGSVTIELLRNAPDTFGGIYTAHSGDTKDKDNNQNYYTIAVEPNTTYTFSYTLESTNLSSFVPYVFYFKSVEDANSSTEKSLALPAPGSSADAEGRYPAYNSLSVATNLNGSNTWSFTTPANADRIQIRFTLGNSADGSTSTATVKDIVIYKTGENIFDFNEWASNANSSGLASSYNLGHGERTITEANSSITFEADGTADGLFTNFILGNCAGYYTMDVKPYTTYSVSYILSANANLVEAGVAIAWHKEDGEMIASHNLFATNSAGYNYHTFNTPAEAAYMQVAFGAFHATGSSGSGTMSNIEICDTGSLFCLGEWKENPKSNQISSGNLNVDEKNNTVTYTSTAHGKAYFTNYGDLSSDTGFYTVDVEPNAEYTFTYDLTITNASGPIYFQPYFAEFNENGENTGLKSYASAAWGKNQYSFITNANTERVMVVFSFHHTDPEKTGECTWIVKDFALCPTRTFEDIVDVHRQVFTYDHANQDQFYGALPEATAPEGYVFGGWYTGENGTGERITPETKVKYNSFSVFANFEEEVDTLKLASKPDKLLYIKGEKLDTTGLSLEATKTSIQKVEEWNDDGDEIVEDGEITIVEKPFTRTFNINSNIYCTPMYLDTVGTQTITASYGGKSVTFDVTVTENETSDIYVNGTVTNVTEVSNNKYTLDYSGDDFNRYTITYYSDSYVKGIITFTDSQKEEFFLEPSNDDNKGSFSSLIDGFIEGETRNSIKTIEFTCLDNELGDFQLKTVTTNVKIFEGTNGIVYYNNNEYEMGIDIRYGGVVAELYDIDTPVEARVYKDKHYYNAANPSLYEDKTKTLVDYPSKLDQLEANDTSLEPTTDENNQSSSDKVNLINTLDRGRYLQQSYYGTSERPYVTGRFNGSDWKYNPVQGGNVGEEPSKVIDYEITDTYVYVKARPLEWEKWSDDHVDKCTHETKHTKKKYGDDVASDTYVEAWYYFDSGMIKVDNRKVDYSGLPDAYTQQEMPALYLIEPLNHFVYNKVEENQAWKNDFDTTVNNKTLQNIEEPEFWGIADSYNEYHYAIKDADGNIIDFENDNDNDDWYDLHATCNENWAAFTASEDADSFGVGIYTPGATDLYFGVMPQKYASDYDADGNVTGNSMNPNYRHAETVNPSPEMPTSYIAPLKKDWFRSYEATTYSYYLTTGTAEDIRRDFSTIGSKEAAAELAKSKIAVPETVYLNPANNTNGQYYVNNILNESDYYNVETVAHDMGTAEGKAAAAKMYLGLHVKDAKSFTVNVTNVTPTSDTDANPLGGEIDLCDSSGNNVEGNAIPFPTGVGGTFTADGTYNLKFSGSGLAPGEKATAKWDITVTMADGSTKTHTAYTVLYAPGRTVGAVAEARQVANSQNEISSWITGANGVDHSQRAPLGSLHGDYKGAGYFTQDPLTNTNAPSGGSGGTATDYIDEVITGVDVDNNVYNVGTYVMQTATNDHDGSRAQSYLGLLTVDGSRYTNTNQIPNLKIGFDALRVGSWTKDSLDTYKAYYTLGTAESFTATDINATPSGWTEFINEKEYAGSHTPPYRETVIPEYNVSDINDKYIHAINQGRALQTAVAARYSNAGTSVLCTVTDKSELRDAVLKGYTQTNTTPEFEEALQKAGTVLGDPSATKQEIGEATTELVENATTEYYALKYDNLFSALEFSQHAPNMTVAASRGTVAYNNGTITVTNAELSDATEAYTDYGATDNYYLVDVKPDKEYVFEYDVTTNGKAQAFMFFYNSSNGDGDVPTKISVQMDGGSWTSKTETNPWWGIKDQAPGKYVIKFTTGSNTYEAGFRFGNSGSVATTSTFRNIKLVEADKYYENVTYPKTEAVYKEYDAYGTLPFLSRIGYTFGGWSDINDTGITDETLATEHRTIYSHWDEKTYTINYDKNGGVGSADAAQILYTDSVNLPTNFARDFYEFRGWASTASATEPEFAKGAEMSGKDIAEKADANNQITLYAVWEKIHTLYFSPNNGDGSIEASNKPHSDPHTIPENNGAITRDGYKFLGWSLDPNATVATYKAGDDLTVSEIDSSYIQKAVDEDGNETGGTFVALHAVWSANPYIITYDANGGSANTATQGYNIEDSLTIPTPTKTGYTFNGWKVTTADGNWAADESFNAGDVVTNKYGDVTLTAQWKINDTALVADTIVVDFGLPVEINPLDNDTVFNSAGSAQTLLGISKDGTSYSNSVTLDCGTLSNSNGTVTFTPTTVVNGITEVYYQASVSIDGVTETLKNKITIAPASNVYYEESFSTEKGTGKTTWKAVTYDDAVTNGGNSGESAVYGYDDVYNNDNDFSNDTAFKVTIDKVNKNTKSRSFTFTGTGFDLIGACGADTGVLVVSIKDSNGTRVKSYIVDTYYADEDVSPLLTQVPVVNWTAENNKCDKYTVDVAAMYLGNSGVVLAGNSAAAQAGKSTIKNNLIDTGLIMNSAKPADMNDASEMLETAGMSEFVADDIEMIWFDDNSVLNGGTGVEPKHKASRGTTDAVDTGVTHYNYIDGIRVYNPLDTDSTYYSASEKNAVYANVVNTIVDAGSEIGGIAYITKGTSALTWSDYQSNGPKDELYLNENNAISFSVKVNPGEKIMLGLRAVNGPTTITISSTKSEQKVENVLIFSATEMYYDITNCIGEITAENTAVTITVTNNNTTNADVNLLALNHIKFSGGNSRNGSVASARSIARSVDTVTDVAENKFLPFNDETLIEIEKDLDKKAVRGVVENGVVVPLVENEPEVPEDENDTTTGDTENGGTASGGGNDEPENVFDLFSLLRGLIKFIRDILFSTVGNEHLF